MSKFDETVKRYQEEKDPVEKKKIKRDLDQMPVTSSQISQAQEREAKRDAEHIKEFNESHNR